VIANNDHQDNEEDEIRLQEAGSGGVKLQEAEGETVVLQEVRGGGVNSRIKQMIGLGWRRMDVVQRSFRRLATMK
jgi:hypothetical protein